MLEIVGLGYWVFGHGNHFVDRWLWVSCSFSLRNSSKKKNHSVVVVHLRLRLLLCLREALSGSAFFAASRAISLQDHEEELVFAGGDSRRLLPLRLYRRQGRPRTSAAIFRSSGSKSIGSP